MASPETALATVQKKSLVMLMADQYNMQPDHFLDAIKQTCMTSKDITVTNGLLAAFLMVAHEYKLNPLIREIFAFPTKSGGIQPIVSIDGWVRLVTTHPAYGGMEISMEFDEKKKPVSCTCQILRIDGIKVPPITEYFDECYRNTDPWNKMPRRMLRHKAIKEAGRVAFGFGGLMDQDEGMDAINITGESAVLERTTLDAKEALKEKMGAKKAAKKEEAAAIPVTPAAPVAEQPRSEAPSSSPFVNALASMNDNALAGTNPAEATAAPAQTVIQPQPTVQEAPEPRMSEDQRKAFLAKAEAKTSELKATVDQAKAKMRELIFNLGATKFNELPASKFDEAIAGLDAWTIEADI